MTASSPQGELISAFPRSDFGRRLLARASAPIGVIDVRHAAAMHARASLGPLRRLDLLDALKLRYGLEPDAGDIESLGAHWGAGLPFAAFSSAAAYSAPDPAWPGPSAQRAATPATATSEPSDISLESAARRYSIKRPGPPAGPKPPPSPIIDTTSPPPDKEIGREPSTLARAQKLKADEGQTLASRNPEPAAPPLPLSTYEDTSSWPRPEGRGDDHELVWERPSDGSSLEQIRSLASERHHAEAGSTAGVSPSLKPRNPSFAPAVARTLAEPLSTSAQSSRVTDLETRVASVREAAPEIVWRQTYAERESSDSARSRLMLASGTTMAPESGPQPGARRVSTPAPIFNRAAEVAYVIDQVRHAIARDIRIERERRGWTR